MKWILFFSLMIGLSVAEFTRILNNGSDPDFPTDSWVPKIVLNHDIRDDKIMKGPTQYVVNRPPVGAAGSIDNSVSQSANKDVTETDLYLLHAIEKIAYKMETMDKRLKRTEELLFHVMEGSNIKRQDACPGNFSRVARNCYHFSERQYNWKSAASMCKSLGSTLLELESREEFMEVVTFIQSSTYLRGHDFWTGGLNPGLLWIWANSARPVIPKNSSGKRPEEVVHGTGRCLKLSINKNKLYEYHGSECGLRHRYICEHEENATIRALKRIQKALVLKDED